MPPDTGGSRYFDTPARVERAQLVQHLARNADEIVYLRAPAGAGKTRLARLLVDRLGDEVVSVWVDAGIGHELIAAVLRQLGIEDDALLQWPEGPIAGLGGRELLLVVDDADELDAAVMAQLAALHARGGHLLLLGRGGLPRIAGDPDVQFVDLPGFEPAESAAFLRQQAGANASEIGEEIAAALHRAARGQPGPLLDALGGLPARDAQVPSAGSADLAVRGRPWRWLAGASVVVLVLLVLVFQDPINRLLAPEPTRSPHPGGGPPAFVAEERTVATPQDTGQGVRPGADRSPPPVALPELSRPADRAADAPAEDAATAPAVDPALLAPRNDARVPREDTLETVMSEALATPDAQPLAPGPRLPTELTTEPGYAAGEEAAGHAAPEVIADPPASDAAVATAPAPVKRHSPEAVPGDSSVVAGTQQPPAQSPAPAPAPAAPAEGRPAAGGSAQLEDVPAGGGAASAGAVTSEAATDDAGRDWLDSRDPGHYTLQLVGARDVAAVREFIRAHGIGPPYAVFERQLNGRSWYSLVAGDYPDRRAALAARDRLPAALGGSDAWPRTFGSIQKIK